MVNSINKAIRNAEKQSAHGPKFGPWECKKQVRLLYGVPSDGSDSAAAALARTKFRHSPTKFPPRGALVWWTGGSRGFGHVAISAGDGFVWSTDIVRPGYFDLVPVGQIHDDWGLTLAGWSEDIDGVCVFTVESRGAHIDAAIANLRGATRQRKKVAAALVILEGIKPL